mmetsp:Transcript_625/g.4231  ORF Transcript_625/g.4231 Transcript_625/m.4231 type:complete len:332 (-) Transcript_625:694-1689(-)
MAWWIRMCRWCSWCWWLQVWWKVTGALDDSKEGSAIDRKRAFVCITGQLHRLELDGKVNNLFQPMVQTHVVDIALVLSTKTASFVVKRSQKVFAGSGQGNFRTLEEVQRKLQNRFGIVRTKELVQPQAPALNQDYVDMLDKGGVNRTLRVNRSESHIRQWSSYMHCMEMLDEFEEFQGARYNVVLRMREDLDVLFPVDFHNLLQHIGGSNLVVQHCDSWGGINDKIAILRRDYALEYFLTPFERFYLRPAEMLHTTSPLRVKNPETFLRKTYQLEGFTVFFLEADKLLAVPVRRMSSKETCYPLGIRSFKCLRKQLGVPGANRLLHAKCSE